MSHSRFLVSRSTVFPRLLFLLAFLYPATLVAQTDSPRELKLQLRHSTEPEKGSGNFHTLQKTATWKSNASAIIVCDMWDLHHCHNAVDRVGQLAPRMNAVLNDARDRGMTIIHAPSSCLQFYKDHPARIRAIETPKSTSLPQGIEDWCKQIPSEANGTYPIDQTDGGEDDDPVIHEQWAKELSDRGLDPKAPWTRQTEALSIDSQKDFISDSGTEIWSILEHKNINNVILVGVHTNMCVLGRPFGLRQMAKNGKNVVLMRDMTDAMYNPEAKPFVSHFSGTDLIVKHIEKYVCPTITSDQLIGGSPFIFPADKRPHIAIVVGEDEYKTIDTVPAFAERHLRKDFRLSYIFADKEDKNKFPGLEVIEDADVLFLSVRRRTPKADQLELFRRFAASRKPMIGIRTSSHAFCLRKKPPEEGYSEWREFDAEVWGGSYSGHTENGQTYNLKPNPKHFDPGDRNANPILEDINFAKLRGHMSMYLTEPLAPSATSYLLGIHPEEETNHAVVWQNVRDSGGKSFYTSMGHVDDFAQDEFQNMLANAVRILANEYARERTE